MKADFDCTILSASPGRARLPRCGVELETEAE